MLHCRQVHAGISGMSDVDVVGGLECICVQRVLGPCIPPLNMALWTVQLPSASMPAFNMSTLCSCMQLHGDRLQSPGSIKQRPGCLGQLPGICALLACNALQPRGHL